MAGRGHATNVSITWLRTRRHRVERRERICWERGRHGVRLIRLESSASGHAGAQPQAVVQGGARRSVARGADPRGSTLGIIAVPAQPVTEATHMRRSVCAGDEVRRRAEESGLDRSVQLARLRRHRRKELRLVAAEALSGAHGGACLAGLAAVRPSARRGRGCLGEDEIAARPPGTRREQQRARCGRDWPVKRPTIRVALLDQAAKSQGARAGRRCAEDEALEILLRLGIRLHDRARITPSVLRRPKPRRLFQRHLPRAHLGLGGVSCADRVQEKANVLQTESGRYAGGQRERAV